MFREVTVWDSAVMTKGTVIKLEGYSPMNDRRFKKEQEYIVVSTDHDNLIIRAKNGARYQVGTWEIGNDPEYDLTIEIVKQVPYVIPF